MTNESPLDYDNQGRMRYHPEFHAKHKRAWTITDQNYLIENYVALGVKTIAAALERTEGVIAHRVWELRKKGLMPKRRSHAKA